MTTLKEVVEICSKYRGRDPYKEVGLFWVSFLWVVACWAAILVVPTWAALVPSLAMAPAFIRLFHFHHEHMHGAFLDKKSFHGHLLRFVNRTLMATDGKLWEAGHNKHHKQVGQYGILLSGAVGLVTYEQYQKLSSTERRVYHIGRNPLVLLVMSYLSIFIGYFNLFPVLTGSRYAKRGLIALAHHIGMLSVVGYLCGLKVLFLMVIPMAVASSAGTTLFYLQHLFQGAKYGEAEDPLLTRINNTTSRFTGSRFVLFLIGDQENHHIHHIDPKVPFYRHREAYDAEPELRKCPDLPLNLRTLKQSLRCFVWHAEEGRFLSRRETKWMS